MRETTGRAIALLIFSAVLAGCSSAEGEKGTGGRGSARPAVEAARVSAGDLDESVDVVGSLAAKFDAEIKSEYGGTVSEVYVTEWVRVKRGAPLARVDTREGEAVLKRAEAAVEAAKAARMEAEAARNRADREHERALNLKEAGLVTQQALDDAKTQKEAAAARVAASSAQVRAAEEDVRQAGARIAKAVIRAPFDGVVAERLVNAGEVVGEMQKVLFRIVDNRLLDLTVTVPSTEMGKVRAGQPIAFTTDALPGRTFTGTVKFINPAVSPADRSVKVVALVRNVPEILKGGLFVKGRIETGRRRNVLQVPRAALLSWDVDGKKADLFVVDRDVARRRAVRTGAVSGDRVEIASGLTAGETVLTRGAFNVKDGDRVDVVRVNGD